jgi:capsular polysaccharide biosynthesis protein
VDQALRASRVTFASRRENAGLVVLAMAVLTLASLAHAIRNPQYTATSQLLLGPSPSRAALRPADQKQFDRQTATFELSAEAEAAILPSDLVAQRVVTALDLDMAPEELADSITASPLSDAVVEVQASAPNPELAARLANGFADQYLAYRSQITRRAVAGLMRASDARSAEARAELGRLDSARDSSASQAPTPADDTEQRALQSERERILAVVQAVDLEATRLRAVGSAHAASGAVISRARGMPERSPANEAVAVGLLVGGAVGGSLVLLRRYSHPVSDSSHTVEAATGMPVLATVPMVGAEPNAIASHWAALSAMLFGRGLGTTLRSVVVVAAERGDDATTVVADLAAECAGAGLPTVAFSADGLASARREDGDGSDPWILSLISVGANLMVLADAVATGRVRRMVDDASGLFRVVLIEGPPLADSGAAVEIGEYCDVVLLVTAADPTGYQALEDAGRALVMLDRPLQGVIVHTPTPGSRT